MKITNASQLSETQINYMVAKLRKHQWRAPWMLDQDDVSYAAWQAYEDAWGNPTPDYVNSYLGTCIIEEQKISLEPEWNTRGCGVRTEFKQWVATHPENHGGLIRHYGYGKTLNMAGLAAYVQANAHLYDLHEKVV